MKQNNFIMDVLNGEALLDDMDAYVAFWHEGNVEQPLQVFLGFTDYEYDRWMKEGNFVAKDILYCRRNQIRLEDYVNDGGSEERSRQPKALSKYLASA